MMMIRLIFLLMLAPFASAVSADEDFISHDEYGQMLYKFPRGVSCTECHGETGKGKVIAEFEDIHGKAQIVGPNIQSKTLDEMIQALNSYHEIMPRYYLTNEEIKAIYDFLKEKTKKRDSQKK